VVASFYVVACVATALRDRWHRRAHRGHRSTNAIQALYGGEALDTVAEQVEEGVSLQEG
jgi:hypothetical protein